MDKIQKSYQEIINECLRLATDKNYIFRGTSCMTHHVDNNVQSTLYRQYKKNGLANEKLNFFNLESEKVSQARYCFASNAHEIQMLTELRHFGDSLAIIDFTRDLNVALYFACQNSHDRDDDPNKNEDGEIILLDMPELKTGIDYSAENIYAFDGTVDNTSFNRVLAQNSIFVHAKYGFINDENSKSIIQSIKVKKELKKDILEYLRKYLNIDAKTMFRDVFGFIKYNKNINPPSYYMGVHALELGEHKEALKNFNIVIKDNPQSYSALNNRSVAYLSLNNIEAAIEDCNNAIELNPGYDFAYLNRGKAKYKKGDIGDALIDYNKAIEINSRNIDAYLLRGGIYIYLKDYENALEDANSALNIDQKSKDALELRCIANLALNRHGDAQKDQALYAFYHPGKIQINKLIGLSYMSNNEFKKGISEFEKIIKTDSNNHHAHSQIGVALGMMGDYRGAKNKFSLVVHILNSANEKDLIFLSEAYYHLGLAKINCDDFIGGISDLEKALKIVPSNTAILNHLGLAHYEVGTQEKLRGKIIESNQHFCIAVDYYTKALDITPDSIEILYNRGLAHEALGNSKEAESDFNEVKRLSRPDDNPE